MASKPKLEAVEEAAPVTESTASEAVKEAVTITKPSAFSLDKFKSKRAAAIANVETLQTALPHHKISEARDFVRLHPNEEEYWSSELCFVNVPIQGQKRETLHLILEDLATRYLPSGAIIRHRLVLATKPHDVFFLCHVPSENTDNTWNETNLQACEQARRLWTKAISRKAEGVESYKVEFARDHDAFPEPRWPAQSLDELIEVTFVNRTIDREDHPGLLRLIGAKQSLS